MATEKRERQRANRQAKLEAERKTERNQTVRSRALWFVGLAAVILAGLYWLSLGGDDNEEETTATTADTTSLTLGTTTTIQETETTEANMTVSAVSAPEPGGSIDGDTECPAEDGSSERITSFASAPPMCIDESASYTAEIATNLGTITVALEPSIAPETVNNFVVLARYHYYDGAPFHRIIPGFVIQGGDAVGEPLGTGNPGYSIDDELPAEGDYQVGSVAMANSGPNTNGSQFFIITGENGVALPPAYSLFGEVTNGMDTVTTIENIPTTDSDAPGELVIIESVTITEG